MRIRVIKNELIYKLEISYKVSSKLEEVWNLLATDSGFACWFPQLRVEGDKLIFEMEDFRETMDLLAYQPQEKIAYTWDTATVSFSLSQQEQGTLIIFEEEIPVDFGNEYADAQKDMTGWLIQNECIQLLLQGQDLPDHLPLQEKWAAFLEEELKR
ncbi:SRPBCC domain-containing protein [Streptococcus suis]|uniref:SRPBCC domain-containing protein n=1 Tax=Streptococcus suis TaxID=1307 RepID=UPI000CF5B218|nr:SRPBCC domain-containing protein [Streptococcus suis]